MKLSNNFQTALQVANNYGSSVVIKNNAIYIEYSEEIQDDLRDADVNYTMVGTLGYGASLVVPMCEFSESNHTNLWK